MNFKVGDRVALTSGRTGVIEVDPFELSLYWFVRIDGSDRAVWIIKEAVHPEEEKPAAARKKASPRKGKACV